MSARSTTKTILAAKLAEHGKQAKSMQVQQLFDPTLLISYPVIHTHYFDGRAIKFCHQKQQTLTHFNT